MKPPGVLVALGSLAPGVIVPLAEDEAHHLRVRRAANGDEVMLFDGAGARAAGRFSLVDRQAVVTVDTVEREPKPPATVLAIGAGDKERFLALAERCTELAVTELIPLVTVRSRTVDTRVRAGTIERAARRAREACKQSGSAWATSISPLAELVDLSTCFPGVHWFVGVPGGAPCGAIDREQRVGWILGPEGGLTAEELDYCTTSMGGTPVGLGRQILRFDTAAVAAAVVTADRRSAT